MLTPRFGYSIFDIPVEECFSYALKNNFSHFEIDLAPRHSNLTSFSKKRIINLKNISEKYDFTYSLHPPSSTNLGHSVKYLLNKNIRYIKKCIKLGAELGVTHITLHLGNFVGHTCMRLYRKTALQRVIDSLKILVQYCAEEKVILALENSAKLHFGSEVELLGDNVNDFDIIFTQIDSPIITLCLDIGHANLNEGALEYIELFEDKIFCIHFHDNHGLKDEHLQINNGNIHWQELMMGLKKIQYNGLLISECFKTEPHIAKNLFLKYWNNYDI